MRLEHVRSEIEYMRGQVSRQRKEILLLQRAGISTASAEALLQRMLDKIDALCAERDKLKAAAVKEDAVNESAVKENVLGRRRQG